MNADQVNEVKAKCAAEWDIEQKELRQSLITEDDFKWSIDPDSDHPLRLVGGVDISFVGNQQEDGTEDACAALVVLSYPGLEVLHQEYEMVRLTKPYIPGYLAFREVHPLINLINRLRETKPELVPQVIFVDGNGVLHYKGFGLASHLGVLSNIPTIGIGKNLLCLDGMNRDSVKEMCKKALKAGGDFIDLRGDSGRVWGVALRCTDQSTKQIYVSVGHRISLDTARLLTHKVCSFRIPEPVRVADLGSRQVLREMKEAALGISQSKANQNKKTRSKKRSKKREEQKIEEEPRDA